MVRGTAMTNEDTKYLCPECWGFVDRRRSALGYRLCLECGEIQAKKSTHHTREAQHERLRPR